MSLLGSQMFQGIKNRSEYLEKHGAKPIIKTY